MPGGFRMFQTWFFNMTYVIRNVSNAYTGYPGIMIYTDLVNGIW